MKELIKQLDATVTAYKELDSMCDRADKLGLVSSGGPFFETIWKAFETLVEIQDVAGWIAWFIWENKCGERGLRVNGKPIRTTRQLAKIILSERGEA